MTSPTRPKPRSARSGKVAAKAAGAPLGRVASTLVASRRRNTEALVDAGLESCSGVAGVLKRRIEILRATLSELRAVGKVMRLAGARESVTHLDALARGTVQLALNSIRELSGLAAATQKGAFEILARRLQDDLAEFKQLLSTHSATPPK